MIAIRLGLVIFGAGSYLLYYKSFLKELGSQTAKLATISDLTKTKSEVEAVFNENLEKIKADLVKYNISYEIQFRYLHEKRSDIIIECYRILVELHSNAHKLTSLFKPSSFNQKEAVINLDSSLKDFNEYIVSNKLFFSESFIGKTQELIKDYGETCRKYVLLSSQANNNTTSNDIIKSGEELITIANKVQEDLYGKVIEIEKYFRKLLRVNEEEL